MTPKVCMELVRKQTYGMLCILLVLQWISQEHPAELFTHRPEPPPVDDGEGAVPDQVLGGVLVAADRLHGDGGGLPGDGPPPLRLSPVKAATGTCSGGRSRGCGRGRGGGRGGRKGCCSRSCRPPSSSFSFGFLFSVFSFVF